MPKKRIKTKVCANCAHTFNEIDNFCPSCGQENHSHNQHLGHLVMELVETELHFDTKFWHSAKSIVLRPGEIVSDWIADRRARHVPPFRMYVFISFLLFFLFAWLPEGEHHESNGISITSTTENDESNGISINTGSEEGFSITKNKKKQRAFEEFTDPKRVRDTSTVPLNNDWGFSTTVMGRLTTEEVLYVARATTHEADSLLLARGEHNRLSRMIVYRSLQLSSSEEKSHEFYHELVHRFAEALFVLMPFFAFILYLLNIRHKRNYYEYLIFSVYFHATVFVLIIIDMLFNWVFHFSLLPLVFVGSWVYLVFSIRNVYGLSWFKSVVKATFLGIVYGITLVVSLLALLLLGVLI